MLVKDTILQNRYRIVRLLNQGGMGAVYEAIDQRLDSIVALKETLFNEEAFRKQFEREARILARLHHPALPSVSDHFTERDGQFLVMHFISGDDLAKMLTNRGSVFSVNEVLHWGDQLLDVLDYLHTQDQPVIHRDIKPQNLKLTARGQVILLDFGLAKGSSGQFSRLTTSGSLFGYTPNYAPLEQIQGTGTDPRSDLYSLAATLYNLITGVTPPDALSRAMAMVNGDPDPLRPASEANPNISTNISGILSQGMALKLTQRPMSAVEMRRALVDVNRSGTGSHTGQTETLVSPEPRPRQANSETEEQSTLATQIRTPKVIQDNTATGPIEKAIKQCDENLGDIRVQPRYV